VQVAGFDSKIIGHLRHRALAAVAHHAHPKDRNRIVAASHCANPPGKQVARTKVPQDPELLRRLLRAKDRMDAASHEAWPVRRLARVSAVSEAHFARSFKEAFGVPPHRYLLTRRIERATALLRDTDLGITEIAFQTGWSSVGTFGRTFRDVMGKSPGELRGRVRPDPLALASVPVCILNAISRPGLTISVSEKRRQEECVTTHAEESEAS
jgi:transcriptional regulator GlxA family with amidase domain